MPPPALAALVLALVWFVRDAAWGEYGRQKVGAESVVFCEPIGLVCRVPGVLRWERGRRDCRNFLCQVSQRLEGGEQVRAASDQTLYPTYAKDIAVAAVAVEQLIVAGACGVMHVVGPDVMTRAGFAQLVAEVFGLWVDAVHALATRELGLAAAWPAFSALATACLCSSGIRAPRSAHAALAEVATERWP